jgi:hypothetical protein
MFGKSQVHRTMPPNADIGHPKLFMIGKASGASFMAAANVE